MRPYASKNAPLHTSHSERQACTLNLYNKTLATMNSRTPLIAVALLAAAALYTGCDESDDPQPAPNTPADSTQAPADSVAFDSVTVVGWTSATHVPPEGERAYFTDFYSPGDTTTVTAVRRDGIVSLTFSSSAWGTATFERLLPVASHVADTAILLPAGTQTVIQMSRGAFGSQGGGGEYELTLLSGSISADFTQVQLVVSAFMNASHGSYELTFHEGEHEKPLAD